MYPSIALVCLVMVPGYFCNDIHKFMSREEIYQIFHTNPDSVPEYEITQIHVPNKLHKRDLEGGTKMHITALGKNINLWLYPTNPILAGADTPVYFARHSPGKPENVEFLRRDGLMNMVGRMFEDPYWKASLLISMEESEDAKVNGYIDYHRLAVRSLPDRIADEYRRRRRMVGDYNHRNHAPFHVVYRLMKNYDENLVVLPIDPAAFSKSIARLSYVDLPDIIYPELLVVVEHSLYRHFKRDIYGLLRYILAFINGVDLKYRSIESPKIRFHISGIILAADPEATPYISKNSLGTGVFDSLPAMYNATTFFYAIKDTFPLGSYDIPITLTSQLFGVNGSEFILGQAWEGFACKTDHDRKTVNSVTIIQDDGSFSGIHIAAHEIGHLLGAPHDTALTEANCLYSNGFLMSFTPYYTKNSSDLSTCSIDRIYKTFRQSELYCLYNMPSNNGKIIPNLMPGKLRSLKAQCESITGRNSPCMNSYGPTNICLNIYCKDHYGRCRETKVAAVDGTMCGHNKFCLHMECVSL